mmetsp:Transcript_21164/g.39491  ORF Transcript_21164/g.39491 Transcript_21164/m.39491 type:complete len:1204 (-) Transcript_21164:370-3981(-)
MALLVFLILVGLAMVHSTNFTLEDSFDESRNYWDLNYQVRVIGSASPILKGRGMVTEFRIRPSGSRNFAAGGGGDRKAGVYIFLRQAIGGELGQWREATFLVPDDLPGPDDPTAPISTLAYYCGAFSSKGFPDQGVLGNRDGIRLQTNKHAVGGNPETGNVVIVSAFGYTYTETDYLGSGAAYVFTGEYYHWTQSTKLRTPTDFVTIDDDDFHFGRCVSIDKQTMDTAAISCSGCDPGKYKTALISGEANGIGSQGRGAVFIYRGSEKTGFKQWTATQMLWPRHNKWYYFGGGFVTADGNTLITDACKGTKCTSNDFENREFDSPMTDLFVYVKQEATGLWSEQQVLTDPLMETNVHSKDFDCAVLHDDTIAIGIGLTHSNLNKYKKDVGKFSGQVLMFYPNLPNYENAETFRHKAGVKPRKDGPNSYRLNKHQWSLHQLLESENPMSRLGGGTNTPWREYFGKYISISGDRMAIGMKGTSSTGSNGNNAVTALFVRPRQGGLWSQQQILIASDEQVTESYGVNLYNSHFVMTGGKRYYKYMSEQAHGKWSCLLVSMFDEFGDGWDGAKLRVDAPDGTYDYFYPTCDVPTTAQLDIYQNPFQFEYCPSVKEQGGMYKFYIVNAEDAKFNWELEWQIDMDLVNWRSGFNDRWGNATDRFIGDIHTQMEFYWNPITLSFEEGPSEGVLPATVTCTSCPARGSIHRHLEADNNNVDIDEVDEGAARSLRHAVKTASPTVSPAPTMAQSESALAEWEKLVMTTSDPLRPWFRADRTGTYFYLSDLEGKTLLRHITQCFGSDTPLTHSCWVNYPDSIPDGDYIARIGGARAGINAGLHTWHFCGVAGSQSEHLQFRVQHGSCYPVQRFTTSRYCTFKQGSTVIADLTASFGIVLDYLTPEQEDKVFKVLTEVLPHTQQSDFSISNQRIDDSSHLHATVHVKLRVSDHGFDPADFDAVSNLEAAFSQYIYKASEKGILSNALATSVGSSSAEDISVDVVAFDTGFIASKPLGEVDDDTPEQYPEEVIEKDWLTYYAPASKWDSGMVSALSASTDVMALLGYIGILVCVAYGVKQARVRYLASQAVIQRDLESATETLLHAKDSAVSSGGGLVRKVHSSLDSFSDNVYAMMNDKNRDASESQKHASIPDVVIPKLDTLLVEENNRTTQIKQKKRRNNKNSQDLLYSSSSESTGSNSSSSDDDEHGAYRRR